MIKGFTYGMYALSKSNLVIRCIVDCELTNSKNLYRSASVQAFTERVKSKFTRIPVKN